MEDLIIEKIFEKGDKTFLIKVFRNDKEIIATGSLNGFTVNETRQTLSDEHKKLSPDDPLVENLINLIKGDLMDTDY